MTRESPAQAVERIATDSAVAVEGLRSEVRELRAQLGAVHDDLRAARAALEAQAERLRERVPADSRPGSWAWLGAVLDDSRVRTVVLTLLVTAASGVAARMVGGDVDAAAVARELVALQGAPAPREVDRGTPAPAP